MAVEEGFTPAGCLYEVGDFGEAIEGTKGLGLKDRCWVRRQKVSSDLVEDHTER